MYRLLIFLSMAVLVLCGCSSVAPQPAAPIEVTRLVEVTAPPIEVTRVVEVTRIVAQTVAPVEVTRVVVQTSAPIVITATPAPTLASPMDAPTQPPAKPAASASAEEVVAAFKAAGLDAEQVTPLTKDDYGIAPYVGSGVHFVIPSLCADCGGKVIVVPNDAERATLRSFYQELGKQSAMLFSWVFEKAPVVVQINGDLPEAQARKYEAALKAIKW